MANDSAAGGLKPSGEKGFRTGAAWCWPLLGGTPFNERLHVKLVSLFETVPFRVCFFNKLRPVGRNQGEIIRLE